MQQKRADGLAMQKPEDGLHEQQPADDRAMQQPEDGLQEQRAEDLDPEAVKELFKLAIEGIHRKKVADDGSAIYSVRVVGNDQVHPIHADVMTRFRPELVAEYERKMQVFSKLGRDNILGMQRFLRLPPEVVAFAAAMPADE